MGFEQPNTNEDPQTQMRAKLEIRDSETLQKLIDGELSVGEMPTAINGLEDEEMKKIAQKILDERK